MQDAPELALGNAYGSNIANIALILGVTAIISPVIVIRKALKRDLPILLAVTVLSVILVSDGSIGRFDGIVLLLVFAGVMGFNIWNEIRQKSKAPETVEPEFDSAEKPALGKSIMWLIVGLLLLVSSSRALVWGAVEIARALGVSDLLIGLTIVAVGTSLPELASSIAAARKGEDDLAFGNIIGSNLFNTLLVVGIAASIAPMDSFEPSVFNRDMPVMAVLTVLLLLFGLPVRKKRIDAGGHRIGRINRIEGATFLAIYVGYIGLLIAQSI